MQPTIPVRPPVSGAGLRHMAAGTASLHSLRRHPLALLAGLALLTAAVLVYLAGARVAAGVSSPPADLFIHSVVTRDGELGWRQLCSDLQEQLPLAVLAQQTEAQRLAEAGQKPALEVDYVGSRPQPKGGEFRLYVVTAHLADGSVNQRMFTVKTQASGCVEEVQ